VVKFLLDTNAIAEVIRPKPSESFLRRFRSNDTRVAIAAITLHETIFGVERMPEGKRKRELSDYLRDVVARMPVLPYDVPAAEWHGRERARLERIGRKVSYADGQIASIAVVNGLTLVTANLRDFKAFEGLRVESWMD
jgi:tRNA(fMet)-specific endonuclease VapC